MLLKLANYVAAIWDLPPILALFLSVLFNCFVLLLHLVSSCRSGLSQALSFSALEGFASFIIHSRQMGFYNYSFILTSENCALSYKNFSFTSLPI